MAPGATNSSGGQRRFLGPRKAGGRRNTDGGGTAKGYDCQGSPSAALSPRQVRAQLHGAYSSARSTCRCTKCSAEDLVLLQRWRQQHVPGPSTSAREDLHTRNPARLYVDRLLWLHGQRPRRGSYDSDDRRPGTSSRKVPGRRRSGGLRGGLPLVPRRCPVNPARQATALRSRSGRSWPGSPGGCP